VTTKVNAEDLNENLTFDDNNTDRELNDNFIGKFLSEFHVTLTEKFIIFVIFNFSRFK
jgi:hypothetical protein